MHQCVSILGVRVDAVTLSEARDRILALRSPEGRFHVMTPNPEMLVAARRNPEFLCLLNSSDLNVPDGAGLLWAARRQGRNLPERVTGIDLVTAIASSPDAPLLFLLGAAPGVAEKAATVLKKRNPALRIAGTFSGSPRVEDEPSIVAMINASGAEMLLVAYGAPRQDMWIRRNFPKLTSVKVAMGIGGTFDFLAGVRSRAPQAFRSLGLEWLWRLLQEPTRFRRIMNAVVVFPFLILTERQSRPS